MTTFYHESLLLIAVLATFQNYLFVSRFGNIEGEEAIILFGKRKLICLSVVNIFLSFTAFLGNALIQVALHKETSLHAQLRLLLRTLSVSDLCVGLVSEPLVVANWLSVVKEH